MDAVIASACRTPIGSFGGAFRTLTAVDLGTVAVREALARAGDAAARVDDVLLGCVLQAGAGMNVARQVARRSGLPVTVPGMTINRVCGSGLQAVWSAAQAIEAGDADCIVAGGTEAMSAAPYLLPDARWGQRMGHGQVMDVMLTDGLTCALESCHMGLHRGSHRRGLRHRPRRAGRLRAREPASRGPSRRVRSVRGRDRRGGSDAAQGTAASHLGRRVSPPRRLACESRDAARRVQA